MMASDENAGWFTQNDAALARYCDAIIMEMDKRSLYNAGLQDGYQKGLLKGRRIARRDVARKMLLCRFPMAQITSLTGLSETEVLDLARAGGSTEAQ